jgi:hypothetical protein
VKTVFASRFIRGKVRTNRNRIANRVWNSISEDLRSAMETLSDIKYYLGQPLLHVGEGKLLEVQPENHMDLVPKIPVSDLHKFIAEAISPPPSPIFRSILKDLETIEVWREGKQERLFTD